MKKNIYQYVDEKARHRDAFIQLSDEELQEHGKVVDAILGTGVLGSDEPNEYIQHEGTILISLDGRSLGEFKRVFLN